MRLRSRLATDPANSAHSSLTGELRRSFCWLMCGVFGTCHLEPAMISQTVQEILGHKDVWTTIGHTHVVNRWGRAAKC
jgi:site-specific recombinase XerD